MKFRSPILSISLRTASALSICRLPSRGGASNTVSGTPERIRPRQSFIAGRVEKGERKDVRRASRLEGGSEADIEDSRPRSGGTDSGDELDRQAGHQGGIGRRAVPRDDAVLPSGLRTEDLAGHQDGLDECQGCKGCPRRRYGSLLRRGDKQTGEQTARHDCAAPRNPEEVERALP